MTAAGQALNDVVDDRFLSNLRATRTRATRTRASTGGIQDAYKKALDNLPPERLLGNGHIVDVHPEWRQACLHWEVDLTCEIPKGWRCTLCTCLHGDSSKTYYWCVFGWRFQQNLLLVSTMQKGATSRGLLCTALTLIFRCVTRQQVLATWRRMPSAGIRVTIRTPEAPTIPTRARRRVTLRLGFTTPSICLRRPAWSLFSTICAALLKPPCVWRAAFTPWCPRELSKLRNYHLLTAP